jgi:hypothetical protein
MPVKRLPRLSAACECVLTTLIVGTGFFASPRDVHAQGAVAFQPIIGTFPDGVMLNVTPVVTADRRYVKFPNMNPVFTTLEGFDNFVVPGAVSGGFGGGFGGGGFGGGGFGGGGGGFGGGAGFGGGGAVGGFNSVGAGAMGMGRLGGFPVQGFQPGRDAFAVAYDDAIQSTTSTMQPAQTPRATLAPDHERTKRRTPASKARIRKRSS